MIHWRSFLFGLLIGALFSASGYAAYIHFYWFKYFQQDGPEPILEMAAKIMEEAQLGMEVSKSAPQISQVADEAITQMTYLIIQQNHHIITRLDRLIEQTKK